MKQENMLPIFCRRNMTREALQLLAKELNNSIALLLQNGATKVTVDFLKVCEEIDSDDSLFHPTVTGE